MDSFLANIRAFFSRLSIGQRIALGLVVFGGLAVLIGISYWANRPDYALLFGSLPESTASEVVEILKSENIDYELRNGGAAIYVPRKDVYDLRLRFAREGVVTDGIQGYEIFDQSTLGMTDFMQKLNLKRALEGELSRTISDIEQVNTARVHLVIPERSPFRETQTEASASVVLELKNGNRLSLGHIEGITALVAGAVEGLNASGVTVLDTKGNMLSDPNAGDEDAMLTSNQLRLQTEKEQHLMQRGQTMLDQMLGPGNAILRVHAGLDFSRSITENNRIDPESATVIAEERLEEEGDVENANSAVRNYELSRSVETIEKSVGEISYLSVSVILNYKQEDPPEDDPEAGAQFVPHSDAEIAEVEALVKRSVGWREERNDDFAISQVQFDTAFDEQIASELAAQQRREQMELYIRYGVMLLALGLAAWLNRSASVRATASDERAMLDGTLRPNAMGEGEVEGQPQITAGQQRDLENELAEEDLIMIENMYTSQLSPEKKARMKAKHKMFEELKESIMAKPEEAAELLRIWMAADNPQS